MCGLCRGEKRSKKVNNMKKSLWIVLAVVAVLAVWGYSVYNGLVEKEEAVHGAW